VSGEFLHCLLAIVTSKSEKHYNEDDCCLCLLLELTKAGNPESCTVTYI